LALAWPIGLPSSKTQNEKGPEAFSAFRASLGA
jgi:hypothetical protein